MSQKDAPTADFEAAIKNFSKVSSEVDALANLGNADAYKLMNKSVEIRKEAIEHEASRRMTSFETEQKGPKSKESLQTHGTLEQLFKAEVELEFDRGVEEEKTVLRGNSAIYESKVEDKAASKTEVVEKKKSESSDDESDENEDTEDENSDEESENESDEDVDTETTDKNDSEGGEDDDGNGSSENEYSENEITNDEKEVDKVVADKVDDSSKQ